MNIREMRVIQRGGWRIDDQEENPTRAARRELRGHVLVRAAKRF
jgi:hypothetical protein